jgi:hypothetical protein
MRCFSVDHRIIMIITIVLIIVTITIIVHYHHHYLHHHLYHTITIGLQQNIINKIKQNKEESISAKIEINKHNENLQSNEASHELFKNKIHQNMTSIQLQQNMNYNDASLRIENLTDLNKNITSSIDILNITIYKSNNSIIEISESIMKLNETYMNRFHIQNETISSNYLNLNQSIYSLNTTVLDMKFEFYNVSLELRYC